MSKKSTAEYNKDTMKTLDAKALKARKDNLHAEYEKEKVSVAQIDQVIAKANEKRQSHLSKMVALEGAYQQIEELEKAIGIDPLSTRLEERASGAKK